jgi:hypothetical protein
MVDHRLLRVDLTPDATWLHSTPNVEQGGGGITLDSLCRRQGQQLANAQAFGEELGGYAGAHE